MPDHIEGNAGALPKLYVQKGNLPETVKAARDVLLNDPRNIFERQGTPVRVIAPADGSIPRAVRLTKNSVTMEIHDRCMPMEIHEVRGITVERKVTFPAPAAAMFLDMDEWGFRPLAGITSCPILSDDGGIRVTQGYDSVTGLWAHNVPQIDLPSGIPKWRAKLALFRLRMEFSTFPFADAPRRRDDRTGQVVVDYRKPALLDEFAFLVSLLTAVCRPSLALAPGLILRAPNISGAGVGKGILGRAISSIAFGIKPTAFPAGHNREELDKRISSELMGAAPVLFLDNLNGIALKSDTLATAMTEAPASVRVLGLSQMVAMNCRAFVMITGNGLVISEDLIRRFLVSELDARVEDPESRKFKDNAFLSTIGKRRESLLKDLLTIFRWGRENRSQLKVGKRLGSYEEWCSWCRDPLITLGCADPIERMTELKKVDPRRQMVSSFLAKWHECHSNDYIAASEVSEDAIAILDLGKNVSRQRVAAEIGKLVDTRVNGYLLKQDRGSGRWSRTKYAVVKQEGG